MAGTQTCEVEVTLGPLNLGSGMMYGNKYLNAQAIFGMQIDSTYIHIHYELLFRSKQLQMQMGRC
jgi:hypothetical protein